MKEVFKKIPLEGYDNYRISKKGNVMSMKYGGHKGSKLLKTQLRDSGYVYVSMQINKKQVGHSIHQLLAITFLGHTPAGHTMVVDHKNGKKADNRLSNLQIITHRENLSKENKKKKKTSSQYTGVSFVKNINKWISQIGIDGKMNRLGYFDSEIEAHEAYQLKLSSLNERTLTLQERKDKVRERKELKIKKQEAELKEYFEYVDRVCGKYRDSLK